MSSKRNMGVEKEVADKVDKGVADKGDKVDREVVRIDMKNNQDMT